MIKSLEIIDFCFNKAFYFPEEPLVLTVQLKSSVVQPIIVKMSAVIKHLNSVVDSIDQQVELVGGNQTVEFQYTPPSIAPRGYGIDLCMETESGVLIACLTTGFDVLNSWTQNPRYGFLSDFFPGRSNSDETMDSLVRYHINGLQFYDWMYRHEQFLTEQEPYIDLLGRNLSRVTVEKLVAAAHENNIAAMPYTAIYAASTPFFKEHPDWALYQANGQPYLLGKNFLVYMDPRPDSPWVNHLLAQFDIVLQEIDFDGIHLDQYGDPKEAYDSRGNKFSLASPLAETINATKNLVLQYRPNGAVVFNAVTNWPIEIVSKSSQDFMYIEVWSPYTWFDDLHKLITQAQDLSNGKPVILAAYIDPEWDNSVRLVDATIFASGGGHIELGENNGMLSDPYFPKYRTISPELSETLRRYYDFAVRYQDAIGPRTADGTEMYLNRILINGAYPSPSQLTNKVWPIVRETDRITAINLINLRGIKSPEWAREVKDPPTTIEQAIVQISEVNCNVNRIWFASPDRDSISLQPIDFTLSGETGGRTLIFKVPYLEYWDLIIIEWE
jgi:dextranase